MTGCDGPASPPPQQPVEAAKKSPEPAEAQVQANPSPAPAAPPVQPDPAPATDAINAAPRSDPGAPEPGRNYFPASKSGVFIERDPSPPPPAREPAVEQQVQQASPQQGQSR